jgi:hypothetical protein
VDEAETRAEQYRRPGRTGGISDSADLVGPYLCHPERLARLGPSRIVVDSFKGITVKTLQGQRIPDVSFFKW